jgi:hypothetical protein
MAEYPLYHPKTGFSIYPSQNYSYEIITKTKIYNRDVYITKGKQIAQGRVLLQNINGNVHNIGPVDREYMSPNFTIDTQRSPDYRTQNIDNNVTPEYILNATRLITDINIRNMNVIFTDNRGSVLRNNMSIDAYKYYIYDIQRNEPNKNNESSYKLITFKNCIAQGYNIPDLAQNIKLIYVCSEKMLNDIKREAEATEAARAAEEKKAAADQKAAAAEKAAAEKKAAAEAARAEAARAKAAADQKAAEDQKAAAEKAAAEKKAAEEETAKASRAKAAEATRAKAAEKHKNTFSSNLKKRVLNNTASKTSSKTSNLTKKNGNSGTQQKIQEEQISNQILKIIIDIGIFNINIDDPKNKEYKDLINNQELKQLHINDDENIKLKTLLSTEELLNKLLEIQGILISSLPKNNNDVIVMYEAYTSYNIALDTYDTLPNKTIPQITANNIPQDKQHLFTVNDNLPDKIKYAKTIAINKAIEILKQLTKQVQPQQPQPVVIPETLTHLYIPKSVINHIKLFIKENSANIPSKLVKYLNYLADNLNKKTTKDAVINEALNVHFQEYFINKDNVNVNKNKFLTDISNLEIQIINYNEIDKSKSTYFQQLQTQLQTQYNKELLSKFFITQYIDHLNIFIKSENNPLIITIMNKIYNLNKKIITNDEINLEDIILFKIHNGKEIITVEDVNEYNNLPLFLKLNIKQLYYYARANNLVNIELIFNNRNSRRNNNAKQSIINEVLNNFNEVTKYVIGNEAINIQTGKVDLKEFNNYCKTIKMILDKYRDSIGNFYLNELENILELQKSNVIIPKFTKGTFWTTKIPQTQLTVLETLLYMKQYLLSNMQNIIHTNNSNSVLKNSIIIKEFETYIYNSRIPFIIKNYLTELINIVKSKYNIKGLSRVEIDFNTKNFIFIKNVLELDMISYAHNYDRTHQQLSDEQIKKIQEYNVYKNIGINIKQSIDSKNSDYNFHINESFKSDYDKTIEFNEQIENFNKQIKSLQTIAVSGHNNNGNGKQFNKICNYMAKNIEYLPTMLRLYVKNIIKFINDNPKSRESGNENKGTENNENCINTINDISKYLIIGDLDRFVIEKYYYDLMELSKNSFEQYYQNEIHKAKVYLNIKNSKIINGINNFKKYLESCLFVDYNALDNNNKVKFMDTLMRIIRNVIQYKDAIPTVFNCYLLTLIQTIISTIEKITTTDNSIKQKISELTNLKNFYDVLDYHLECNENNNISSSLSNNISRSSRSLSGSSLESSAENLTQPPSPTSSHASGSSESSESSESSGSSESAAVNQPATNENLEAYKTKLQTLNNNAHFKNTKSTNYYETFVINDIVIRPYFYNGNDETDFKKLIEKTEFKNTLFIFNENYESYSKCADQQGTNASIRSYKCTLQAWGLPNGNAPRCCMWEDLEKTKFNITVNGSQKSITKTSKQIIDEAIEDILRVIKLRSISENFVKEIIYSGNKSKIVTVKTNNGDLNVYNLALGTYKFKEPDKEKEDVLKHIIQSIYNIPNRLMNEWDRINTTQLTKLDTTDILDTLKENNIFKYLYNQHFILNNKTNVKVVKATNTIVNAPKPKKATFINKIKRLRNRLRNRVTKIFTRKKQPENTTNNATTVNPKTSLVKTITKFFTSNLLTEINNSSIKKHAGLNNPGNVCWLNSGLQLLGYIDDLIETITKFVPANSNNSNNNSKLKDIKLFFTKLINDNPNNLSSNNLWKKNINNNFDLSIQQDSQEGILKILNYFREELRINIDILSYIQVTYMYCDDYKKIDFVKNIIYSLEVSKIKSNLDNYLNNILNCIETVKHIECNNNLIYSNIQIIPNKYFIIHLKLFDNNSHKKTTNLNISYKIKIRSISYKLSGFIVHIGSTANSGHYVFYKIENENTIIAYDDSIVKTYNIVSIDELLKYNSQYNNNNYSPYILLYEIENENDNVKVTNDFDIYNRKSIEQQMKLNNDDLDLTLFKTKSANEYFDNNVYNIQDIIKGNRMCGPAAAAVNASPAATLKQPAAAPTAPAALAEPLYAPVGAAAAAAPAPEPPAPQPPRAPATVGAATAVPPPPPPRPVAAARAKSGAAAAAPESATPAKKGLFSLFRSSKKNNTGTTLAAQQATLRAAGAAAADSDAKFTGIFNLLAGTGKQTVNRSKTSRINKTFINTGNIAKEFAALKFVTNMKSINKFNVNEINKMLKKLNEFKNKYTSQFENNATNNRVKEVVNKYLILVNTQIEKLKNLLTAVPPSAKP